MIIADNIDTGSTAGMYISQVLQDLEDSFCKKCDLEIHWTNVFESSYQLWDKNGSCQITKSELMDFKDSVVHFCMGCNYMRSRK